MYGLGRYDTFKSLRISLHAPMKRFVRTDEENAKNC